ncbi:hypothetical protein BFS14_04730 [Serratia fonticola]|uniref:DUF4198 domain-containing protein n=1 Tax=Serratia fonticola TaxID=47917 RepID=UPI0008FD8AA5|nr:DUF4198 domain-containing protein [Serratia fonticola]OIX88997.1 hypothetical protein BFS14_04730 [Serratia fonticola]QCR60117.1 DUF4198 domain-containing protein [Serratia fonticola]
MQLKKLVAILPFWFVSHSQAHSLWVNALPAAGGQSTIELGYGDEFPSAEAIPEDRLHIFAPAQLIGKDGDLMLKPGKENYQFVTEKPLAKGSYAAIAIYKPTYWSKNKSGWQQQSRTEMPDALYCERASMFGKTIVNIDGATETAVISQPQGLQLEIIPLANPATIKPGQPLPIQVLYDGKPLKNADVTATFAGFGDQHEHHGHTHSHAKAFLNQTDGKGKVNVYPLKAGYWVVETEHKLPYVDKAKCDESVLLSTLTFTISE